MPAVVNSNGTRFRLFPQAPFLHPGRAPVVITVANPAGSIGSGPCSDRMYLIDPIGKKVPYGYAFDGFDNPQIYLPPWQGAVARPVQPDADGHFDHIAVRTPEFERAHVFGAVCLVLEIWEKYCGRKIDWHFARDFDRLEIAMLPSLDNAHVGYGFMEVGAAHLQHGRVESFALNFDVIAHEFGHLLLYSTVGVPDPEVESGEYLGFQEAAADMTAIISVLHFDEMVHDLLDQSNGNLYTYNELSRFSELSTSTQIRLAANSVKLSQFAEGWDDEHELSQPLTGALFDLLVDVFQDNLVIRGLIDPEISAMSRGIARCVENEPTIHAAFAKSYSGARHDFKLALLDARDILGKTLAETWKQLSPRYFDYANMADVLLAADRGLTGGYYRRAIVECFQWREIGEVRIGPRLSRPTSDSHAFSARTLLPEHRHDLPKQSFREQMILSRHLCRV